MESFSVDADAPVVRCKKTPVGSNWPLPVEQRMWELVEIANAVGLSTSKQELLAALICDVAPDSASLEGALRRYRVASAGEVAIDPEVNGSVITIHKRAAGRPGAG
jgi:hypothetical protein